MVYKSYEDQLNDNWRSGFPMSNSYGTGIIKVELCCVQCHVYDIYRSDAVEGVEYDGRIYDPHYYIDYLMASYAGRGWCLDPVRGGFMCGVCSYEMEDVFPRLDMDKDMRDRMYKYLEEGEPLDYLIPLSTIIKTKWT